MVVERVEIRNARPEDADAIVRLIGQLGYRSTAPDVVARLEELSDSAHDRVLVAEADGVVALASLHRVPLLAEGGHFARVTTLVVDESRRGSGLAETMLGALEGAARAWGCTTLELSCGRRPERERAHAFYESHGFVDSQQWSIRYWKDI